MKNNFNQKNNSFLQFEYFAFSFMILYFAGGIVQEFTNSKIYVILFSNSRCLYIFIIQYQIFSIESNSKWRIKKNILVDVTSKKMRCLGWSSRGIKISITMFKTNYNYIIKMGSTCQNKENSRSITYKMQQGKGNG